MPIRQLPLQLGLHSPEVIQLAVTGAPPLHLPQPLVEEKRQSLQEKIGDRFPVGVSWQPDSGAQDPARSLALFNPLQAKGALALISLTGNVSQQEQEALPGLIVPPDNLLMDLLPVDRLALIAAIGMRGGRGDRGGKQPGGASRRGGGCACGRASVSTVALVLGLFREYVNSWYRNTTVHAAPAGDGLDSRVAHLAERLALAARQNVRQRRRVPARLQLHGARPG